MWDVSRVWICEITLPIAPGNIFPFSSNANVRLSFPKWTRWMSRMCDTAPTEPHQHACRFWWWCLVIEPLLHQFGSSVLPSFSQPSKKNESFITISSLAQTDVTAGPLNSLNLADLPLLRKIRPTAAGKQITNSSCYFHNANIVTTGNNMESKSETTRVNSHSLWLRFARTLPVRLVLSINPLSIPIYPLQDLGGHGLVGNDASWYMV